MRAKDLVFQKALQELEMKKPNMIGRNQGKRKNRGSMKKLNSPEWSMDSQSVKAPEHMTRAAYFQEEYKKVMERHQAKENQRIAELTLLEQDKQSIEETDEEEAIERSIHKLASDIDFSEQDGRYNNLHRFIEHKNRIR